MKTKSLSILAVCLIAFVALIGLGMALSGPQANAAPLAAPTPLANDTVATNSIFPINFWNASVLTASGASTQFELAHNERLDLQYVIDQTLVNTATLKIQFSCDGSTWTDGINIVASNAADANAIVQTPNFCRYTRLYATLSNARPVTVTAIAVAK